MTNVICHIKKGDKCHMSYYKFNDPSCGFAETTSPRAGWCPAVLRSNTENHRSSLLAEPRFDFLVGPEIATPLPSRRKGSDLSSNGTDKSSLTSKASSASTHLVSLALVSFEKLSSAKLGPSSARTKRPTMAKLRPEPIIHELRTPPLLRKVLVE